MKPSPHPPLCIESVPLGKEEEMAMVQVEGGRFWLGDEKGEVGWEKPVHEVELSRFWIAQYPVSQRLWTRFMGSFSEPHWQGDARPMDSISWEDSQEFIRRINFELGLSGEEAFRMPTSAEWEFAARGGVYAQGYPYPGSHTIDSVAWYKANSFGQSHPTGLKPPNALGLYDMGGNLWEWVGDWYDDNYYALCKDRGLSPNPQGAQSGHDRVLRGGSWFITAQYCRVGIRAGRLPDTRLRSCGLRLSRTAM